MAKRLNTTHTHSMATIHNQCTRCRHTHESTRYIPSQRHATLENAAKLIKEFIEEGDRIETCPKCSAYCEAAINFAPAG